MRKKFIVYLLLIGLAVGCIIPQIKVGEILQKKEEKLHFEPEGIYHVNGFGENFVVHYFDEPNSNIVVFEIENCIYLVGENTGNITGSSYADAYIENSKFIALSEHYLLFENSLGNKIAVDINLAPGEFSGNSYLFSSLPEEEQKAFVYTTKSDITIPFPDTPIV